MYGKLLFVIGAGIGYVVGTSRGRRDYEMLKRRVSQVWLDSRVQDVAKKAGDFAEENIPMGEKVSEAVDSATKMARENTAPPATSTSAS